MSSHLLPDVSDGGVEPSRELGQVEGRVQMMAGWRLSGTIGEDELAGKIRWALSRA